MIEIKPTSELFLFEFGRNYGELLANKERK